MLPVTLLATVSPDEQQSVLVEVGHHRTLADVVAWGLASRPTRMVRAVIKQDEFTQDVVVPYREAGESPIWLVYDTS